MAPKPPEQDAFSPIGTPNWLHIVYTQPLAMSIKRTKAESFYISGIALYRLPSEAANVAASEDTFVHMFQTGEWISEVNELKKLDRVIGIRILTNKGAKLAVGDLTDPAAEVSTVVSNEDRVIYDVQLVSNSAVAIGFIPMAWIRPTHRERRSRRLTPTAAMCAPVFPFRRSARPLLIFVLCGARLQSLHVVDEEELARIERYVGTKNLHCFILLEDEEIVEATVACERRSISVIKIYTSRRQSAWYEQHRPCDVRTLRETALNLKKPQQIVCGFHGTTCQNSLETIGFVTRAVGFPRG